MAHKPEQFLPLSPAAFHILLALAGEDLHGYGIIQKVRRESDDQYRLGPGTLYDNLHNLMLHDLVTPNARRRAECDDPRRRYYHLTAFGRSVLSAEVKRLEGALRQAKAHLSFRPRRA